MARSIARAVTGASGMMALAALAGDGQVPVAALGSQGFDVRAGSLGHAQPVEGQQRDQRVLGRGAETGGLEVAGELLDVGAPDGE